MDEFFTRSGRVDSYEFEKVSVSNIEKSLGKIKGVTGGTLTFSYYSDLKVSGELEIIDTKQVENCLVRVWYVPSLDGKTRRIELCTCFASTSESRYENGKWSCKVQLRSVLARHIDDKLHKHYTMSKGKGAVDYFTSMFKWLGGAYKVTGVKNRKFTKTVVAEFGKHPMEVLQYIASFVGGEITCDTHGRTVLKKYTVPSKRSVVYELPSGAYSVTLPGYNLTDSTSGTPNRVAVKFKYSVGKGKSKKDKTLYGLASVSKSNATSKSKTGRYITECVELNNLSPKTQAKVNAVAKSQLKKVAQCAKYYEIECYYLPIHRYALNGNVVRFRYGSLDIDAVVASIDMELGIGGKMKVMLRSVRKHG